MGIIEDTLTSLLLHTGRVVIGSGLLVGELLVLLFPCRGMEREVLVMYSRMNRCCTFSYHYHSQVSKLIETTKLY